jgi:hypothetical protein
MLCAYLHRGAGRRMPFAASGGKERFMLGIQDKWVFLGYALSVAGMLLCVVYGIATWNRGAEPVRQEDVAWAQEEKEDGE